MPLITGIPVVGIEPQRVERIDSNQPAAPGTGFSDLLHSALQKIEETTSTANQAVSGMLNNSVDVHEAMIALHEAEETFEITVAIRNKFVQAYQEIMRMPL